VKTGYVWHERYAWHDTGTFAGLVPPNSTVQPFQNFESPESKSRFHSLVEVSGLLAKLHRIEPKIASDDDILRVHTEDHLNYLKSQSELMVGDAGDGWSPFGHKGLEIARLAAGGTIAATEAVVSGQVHNAYALVRPPGHHAERERGMGYCLLANIAIAIEWARAHAGVRRVAVVDYDVHHGNGTQSVFYADPDVLTISIHQDRLFPKDSGLVTENGSGKGKGSALNVPLPSGSGNGAYDSVFDEVVIPALRAFKPDLIMVASGFDAAGLDPLGRMNVTAAGFRGMTEKLVAIAHEVCEGRLVMSHEGGYSPVYVPYCGLAVLEGLSGENTGVDDPFAFVFEDSPAQPLKDWEGAVIAQAREIAEILGMITK
jgi:acetoin utilization deacetylase AcuC-like enzyme